MNNLEQFDIVTATFNPKRKDDLVDGAEKFINYRGKFQCSYILCSGEYVGQWAMMPLSRDIPFAWCPFTDLEDIIYEKDG